MIPFGLDWETTRFPAGHPWVNGAYPVSLGIVGMRSNGTPWKESWVWNHNEVTSDPYPVLRERAQAVIDKGDMMIAHNAKFDLNWCSSVGLDLSKKKIYCTQVAEYLIRGQVRQPYNLAYLSEYYGIPPKMDKVKMYWDAGYETSEIPLNILIPYMEQDCFNTLSIYQRQQPLIKKLGLQKMLTLDMEMLRELSAVECRGMKVIRERAEQYADSFRKEVTELDTLTHQCAGREFNLSSTDELSAVLFGGIIKVPVIEEIEVELKDGTRKTKTRNAIYDSKVVGMGFKPPEGSKLEKEGYYSVGKDTVAQLKGKTKQQKDMLKYLTDRSVAQKALETFVGEKPGTGLINKIREDGCIHPSFNMTIARTGRLTSSDPNGQNLPRKGTSPVKKIFVPRFDLIGNGDLSQLEWRVAAYLSQDPVAIAEILSGVDYHTDNAIKFFGGEQFRTEAKGMGFLLLYGGTAYGLYMNHKMPRLSLKRFEEIVEQYYEKYNGLKRWQNSNIASVYKNKGFLQIPSGRIYYFEKHPNKGYDVRKIKNYPVQGFSSDIVKLAMVVLKKRMVQAGLLSQIICQVHDSIVKDLIKTELDAIARMTIKTFEDLPVLMKQFWGIDFNVPLSGEYEFGPDYGTLEKYKL